MSNTLNGGYKWIRNCLACDSTNLYMIMDFGRTPLPNAFTTLPTYDAPDYPLELMHCKDCKHFQLGGAPAPEDMFTDYLYVNSASTLDHHHENLIQDCEADGLLKQASNFPQTVLDVGGNSGFLASLFRAYGHRAFVIDPSENLQGQRFRFGVPSYTGMFTSKLADDLGMKFNLITALNVVPHTPNPYDMLLGMKKCLAPGGHILIELVYFKSTWETRDFGQIYFEHFSYFTVNSMRTLADRVGLRIEDIKFFPEIHGGTMRFILAEGSGPCFISKDMAKYNYGLAEHVAGLEDIDHLKHWRFAVESNIVTLANKVRELHNQGRTIVAYGASAKSSTLFNHKLFKSAAESISYVVDDNPLKVNRWTPGSHIPIESTSLLKGISNPVILITPHNFRKEITQKIKGLTNKATLLHYVPSIEVEEIG